MASNAERVLSGILSKKNPRRDLLAKTVLRVDDSYFTADALRNIFRMLVKYYDRTAAVMPVEILQQAFESNNVEAAKILAYVRTYEKLQDTEIDDAAFTWSLDALVEERANFKTGEALAEGMEILERGYEDSKGNKYTGGQEARAYVVEKLSSIDKTTIGNEAPEGDIFIEAEQAWEKYAQVKSGDKQAAIKTGIRPVDARIPGYGRGELCLVCGFSNQGKSQIVTQSAWDAAINQGKNVFFATTETLRDQVIRRIIARHSKLSQFDHPIDAEDLRRGTLNAADEKIFREVIEDWRYNTSYGKLNVIQMPTGATTLSYMENRLREYSREQEVSLCIIDYLTLFKAETKRASEREEFNEILRRAKGIAQSFNDGAGIPVVSPWQVNRTGYQDAARNGRITQASLSDTSESAKSPDMIMAIIRDEDEDRTMNLQFLKMRDGAIPPILPVSIDFRYTYIGDNVSDRSLSPLHNDNAGIDEMLTQIGG